jgi:hypothetical protein
MHVADYALVISGFISGIKITKLSELPSTKRGKSEHRQQL